MEKTLPAIPAKRYFTIGEVSELCGVKPYVLRYWEQEFTQLKPMKRRGNRRYYQHHEVLLIRRIRGLLYEQGFTISGARNRLTDGGATRQDAATRAIAEPAPVQRRSRVEADLEAQSEAVSGEGDADLAAPPGGVTLSSAQVRQELLSIRGLLAPEAVSIMQMNGA
jgi:DNA-binding transcriptional MerR regulator